MEKIIQPGFRCSTHTLCRRHHIVAWNESCTWVPLMWIVPHSLYVKYKRAIYFQELSFVTISWACFCSDYSWCPPFSYGNLCCLTFCPYNNHLFTYFFFFSPWISTHINDGVSCARKFEHQITAVFDVIIKSRHDITTKASFISIIIWVNVCLSFRYVLCIPPVFIRQYVCVLLVGTVLSDTGTIKS